MAEESYRELSNFITPVGERWKKIQSLEVSIDIATLQEQKKMDKESKAKSEDLTNRSRKKKGVRGMKALGSVIPKPVGQSHTHRSKFY